MMDEERKEAELRLLHLLEGLRLLLVEWVYSVSSDTSPGLLSLYALKRARGSS
jgi:hypothetical protein